MKKLGFKKSRLISNIIYGICAVILVYCITFIERNSTAYIVCLGISVALFCVGMIVYSKGCRCPKCDKLQPRYAKYRCVDCQEELK